MAIGPERIPADDMDVGGLMSSKEADAECRAKILSLVPRSTTLIVRSCMSSSPLPVTSGVTNQQVQYRQQGPMKQDRAKRDPNKFCRYHNDIGHHTNNCYALKDEVERLIREGWLQQYTRQDDEGLR